MRLSWAAAAIVLLPSLSGCFAFGPAGAAPTDYLTDRYAKWHVEVDYTEGQRPDASVLEFLHDRLAPLVAKPGGIDIATDDQLAKAQSSWDGDALVSYADSHQNFRTGGDTVVTHLLYLSGHFASDTDSSRVLGVTLGHDLVVLFPESMKASCDPILSQVSPCPNAATKQAVLLHEFGHVLGLVDNGVPMVRPHEASSCNGAADEHHSTNQHSVMYCAVETNQIFQLLGGNPPQDFDADDHDDLRAARGT